MFGGFHLVSPSGWPFLSDPLVLSSYLLGILPRDVRTFSLFANSWVFPFALFAGLKETEISSGSTDSSHQKTRSRRLDAADHLGDQGLCRHSTI